MTLFQKQKQKLTKNNSKNVPFTSFIVHIAEKKTFTVNKMRACNCRQLDVFFINIGEFLTKKSAIQNFIVHSCKVPPEKDIDSE